MMLDCQAVGCLASMRMAAWAVILSAFLTPLIQGQQNPTLAEVLKENSIPFPPASIPHLNP